MTERSVAHASFCIERVYPVPPSKVFNAFADPAAKAKWFAGPPEWEPPVQTFDFRVGGRDTSRGGGPKGDPAHSLDCTYWDIIPDERIVYTYEMGLGGKRISVSLSTLEFKAEGEGTRLVMTEHGAFFDGYDNPAGREEGTRWVLEMLGASLEDKPAPEFTLG